MLNLIYLGLFLPLLGFLILMAFSSKITRPLTNFIGCTTIFISFLCFSSFLFVYSHSAMDPIDFVLYNWIPVHTIHADFSLHIDPLALLMTLIITGVGFLIHYYSMGYMEHDEDFARFFACMNFFVFAMLLLVLAGNLLLLFVGWEGVGLASYLLIGYYYHRPVAAYAATKAFVVNRIGDLGLLLGLLLTFHTFGTSDISEINQRVAEKFAMGAPVLTVLTLLYFIGATGKSAQIPLHVWLPDAMEGPTPVSALIHAATMVTAGVYLVVRMHPVFHLAPMTLQIIGVVGAATALFASICALGQIDLKRVLAYSTVSQLGLMFLACGAGAFYSAMFHLTTHAFMKALLFLSAGNVIHMMQGITDMNKMGDLAKKFPKTHWLFLIGVLAMSGIPPLAAFFSKDLILDQEYLSGYEVLFYIGLIASILTAFYLTRAYCLTFFGHPHLERKILNAIKEAPRVMLIPVTLLAVLSIIGGFLGFAFVGTPILERFLNQLGITPAEWTLSHGPILTPETILSIVGGVLGIAVAAFVYVKHPDQVGSTFRILKKAFYIDELYDILFVRPLKALARFISDILEPKVFDASIRHTVNITQRVAIGLQQFQSGQIRSSVAWMVVGMVLLIALFVFNWG